MYCTLCYSFLLVESSLQPEQQHQPKLSAVHFVAAFSLLTRRSNPGGSAHCFSSPTIGRVGQAGDRRLSVSGRDRLRPPASQMPAFRGRRNAPSSFSCSRARPASPGAPSRAAGPDVGRPRKKSFSSAMERKSYRRGGALTLAALRTFCGSRAGRLVAEELRAAERRARARAALRRGGFVMEIMI